MNLNFNLEKFLIFGSGTNVFGLRKCNYEKFLEMYLRNKINKIIGRHFEWSHLNVCWCVSEDTSLKIEDIYENSRGALKNSLFFYWIKHM